jgi:hypothetical protein
MNTSKQYRQGDVLVERVGPLSTALPKSKAKRVILAHGEVTGHAHAIADAPVAANTHDDGSLVFAPEQAQGAPIQVSAMEIKGALAALKHDEHSAISLAGGTYKVTRQREYSPEAIRNVAD